MNALDRRLSDLFHTGHAVDDVELFHDSRVTAEMPMRAAAVLAAVTDRERPGVLMIHRPSNMRAHPGQVALPGGKLDPGETPVEAALREAWEELGIDPGAVRVIGASDRYRTGTGYDITPVVGVVPPDIEISPNPAEVAQWFEAPLDHVLNPANHRRTEIERDGAMHPIWHIPWQDHNIWGVTAGILVNLSRRLRWRLDDHG